MRLAEQQIGCPGWSQQLPSYQIGTDQNCATRGTRPRGRRSLLNRQTDSPGQLAPRVPKDPKDSQPWAPGARPSLGSWATSALAGSWMVAVASAVPSLPSSGRCMKMIDSSSWLVESAVCVSRMRPGAATGAMELQQVGSGGRFRTASGKKACRSPGREQMG